MGFVWSLLLSFANEEWWEDGKDEPRHTCEPPEQINEWIADGKLVSLIEPTYAEGAGYGIDANLLVGGYKRFDINGFIEVVKAQRWKDRASVQLRTRLSSLFSPTGSRTRAPTLTRARAPGDSDAA
jgi:hypothetical protein